jgi:hypothetical protein
MNMDDFIKMEEREEMVRRLLEDKSLHLTEEKIASLANVSVKVVKEIKEEIGVS